MNAKEKKLAKIKGDYINTFNELIYNILDCKWNNMWQGASKINQIIQSFYIIDYSIYIIDHSIDHPEELNDLINKIKENESNYGFNLADYLKTLYSWTWTWQHLIATIKDYCKEKNIKFNWHNYHYIIENKFPINLLNDFYSDFRGNIITIHKIYNNEYNIIETEDDDGISFYLPYVNIEFDTFEHALLYNMFDKHYSTVSLMYDKIQEEKNEKK